jgi:hypothetical protein
MLGAFLFLYISNMKYLDYCDLNQELLSLLPSKHKEVLMCLSGNSGQYAYRKLLNETLWRFDLEILVDMGLFFALQEMYDYASLMNKAIEIKTLIYIKSILRIN